MRIEDKMQMDGDETQTEDELRRVPAARSQFAVKCQRARKKRLISS